MEWGIVVTGLYLLGMLALAIVWAAPDERMARPTQYGADEESPKPRPLKKAA